MDKNRYVTRSQAAQIAGVHFNTIRLWEENARLHPRRVKRGRRESVLISLSELESIMDERAEASNTIPISEAANLRERLARLEGEREALQRQLDDARAERRELLDRLAPIRET